MSNCFKNDYDKIVWIMYSHRHTLRRIKEIKKEPVSITRTIRLAMWYSTLGDLEKAMAEYITNQYWWEYL